MKIGITDYAEKYIEEHTTRKKYYSEESYNKIKQKLEAYENMRKEAIEFIESMDYCGQEDYFYDNKAKDPCGNDNTFNDSKNKLLNILNKVGGSDETI